MKLFLSLAVFLYTSLSLAEYRVFMLLLNNSKSSSARQIETTLDPEQFKTLYPLNENETLTYVDTWMCKGRTDAFRPHCEKPLKPAPVATTLDRSPASVSTQSPDIKN